MKIISKLTKLVYLIPQIVRSKLALRYAKKQHMAGWTFGYFGRQLGYNLLKKFSRLGISYVLTPVNIVRYFEFPFAWSCLPKAMHHCLDIGSPRLFSLYVAQKYPEARILMINPDLNDISQTAEIICQIHLENIKTECAEVDKLSLKDEKFDCIWSISVIEHIADKYDDKFAIRAMYDSLNEGGVLIITVPVDRVFWNEYREFDYYGMHDQTTRGKYFFQRWYDKNAIWERLVAAIGQEPRVVRWFGETEPGSFVNHQERWMRQGHNCTVDDPKEITDHYRDFPSWEEMPGMGVCGLMFEKDQ